MESADFDKTPVLPGGGSSPSNSLPPEISVSFRETFCIPAVMNTPRISRRSGKFMVDGRQKTWYNTACDFPGRPYACVAQLVEQLTRNEQVAGSSPATSSKRRHLSKCRCRLFLYPFTYLCSKKSPATGRGLLICFRLRLALLAHQSSDNRSTLLFSHTVWTSFCTAIKRGPCKSSASQVS